LQSFKPNSIKTSKNFGLKKSEGVSRNAEFHADFRNVEKNEEKKFKKKVINKYVTEKSTFCTVGKYPPKNIFEGIRRGM
jgi:AAA+ superfamily predicted ATPase